MPTVTLFDNFNAKNSTQEEVAETFVSNEDFFSIAKNNHTFVLGPRGCGKTTMFKMLTTSALSTWNPPSVREYDLKNSIPFLAIYIPSDELWKDQLTSITSGLKNEPDLVKFVTNALNSNNIFTNFCNGIKNHLKYLEVDDKKNKEFAFSQLLIKSWEIEDCAPTLSSIKLALGERRKYLIQKVKKFVFQRRHGMQKGTEFEEYFFSDFLTSLRIAMTALRKCF